VVALLDGDKPVLEGLVFLAQLRGTLGPAKQSGDRRRLVDRRIVAKLFPETLRAGGHVEPIVSPACVADAIRFDRGHPEGALGQR